ncbi:MAG TPA: hypothetical protein VIX82_10480 [Solirubrobacteraceae bacterium]
MSTQSPVRRTIGFLKETWAEFDYAQRRLVEIQTGRPILPARRQTPAQLVELEGRLRSQLSATR